MSQVEVVRRFMDHARTDPDSAWGIFDADVVWEVATLAIPDFPPTFHGPDGVREFFRRWIGTFDDWGYEVGEVIQGRNAVVVRVHQWGRGKGSGASVEGRFWQVWVMRSDKAVRVRHLLEKAEAFEAAGLSE